LLLNLFYDIRKALYSLFKKFSSFSRFIHLLKSGRISGSQIQPGPDLAGYENMVTAEYDSSPDWKKEE